MKQVIAALLTFFVVAPAFGKDTWYRVVGPDGNHLIVTCEAGTGTKQDAYDAGYCQGLVTGVAASINSEDGADLVTPNPSISQMMRVVQKYMDDHPEELSKPATYLIRVSLIKAFPKKH